MDATQIRHTSTGRPYQVVAWTQQWQLRADGTWCRVAQVYADGALQMWLVPDDTQN